MAHFPCMLSFNGALRIPPREGTLTSLPRSKINWVVFTGNKQKASYMALWRSLRKNVRRIFTAKPDWGASKFSYGAKEGHPLSNHDGWTYLRMLTGNGFVTNRVLPIRGELTRSLRVLKPSQVTDRLPTVTPLATCRYVLVVSMRSRIVRFELTI